MTPGLFRLLLASAVVVHHSLPIRLGGVAVGLFFVLSGYWIARMWRDRYAKLPNAYATFLISRWWRLAPLFLATHAVAVVLVMAGFRVGNAAAVNDWRWWLTQPGIAGSTQVDVMLPPAWSLDVEMQFYIVAPLLVGGLALQPRHVRTCLIVAAITWCWLRMRANSHSGQPVCLDVHLGFFMIGMAYAASGTRPSSSLAAASAGLAGVAVATAVLIPASRPLIWSVGASQEFVAAPVAAFFLIVLVTSAAPFAISTVYRRGGTFDRWLGDLSYPLYLFHWLPRDWYYAQAGTAATPAKRLPLLAASVIVAYAGAVVLLVVIDRPLQRLRERWVGQPRLPVVSGTPPAAGVGAT